ATGQTVEHAALKGGRSSGGMPAVGEPLKKRQRADYAHWGHALWRLEGRAAPFKRRFERRSADAYVVVAPTWTRALARTWTHARRSISRPAPAGGVTGGGICSKVEISR